MADGLPAQSPARQRIGLLGGSFNPAHGGHRAISLRVMEALGLDAVWWLVSPGNPLKPKAGMAPLAARLASAHKMARNSRILAAAPEAVWGTRYTIDTLEKLRHRFPQHDFIWLMGADNLAQFDRWRDWRKIALTVPIAVIARPSYDAAARSQVATGWLRDAVRPSASCQQWTAWSLPALVFLRFPPDPRSASAIREADPLWHHAYGSPKMREPLTRQYLPVSGEEERF